MPSREPRLPRPLEAVWIWLLGIALVVVVGLSVGVLAALVAVAEGLKADAAIALVTDPVASPLVTSPSWIAVSIAANELALFGIVLFWKRRLGLPFGQLVPVAVPSLRAALGAVLLPFGLAPLAELMGELARRALPSVTSPDQLVIAVARGTSAELFALILALAAGLPAIVEELMFRGLVTTAFQRYSVFVKLAVPSLLFGVFHLEPTQVAGTSVLGIAFGLVRLYTGTIWACMLSHFAYNAGVIVQARWLLWAQPHVLSWSRVGIGLALAALAYVLLVGDLGRRPHSPLSMPPPSRRSR